jgi:hypothetical protein
VDLPDVTLEFVYFLSNSSNVCTVSEKMFHTKSNHTTMGFHSTNFHDARYGGMSDRNTKSVTSKALTVHVLNTKSVTSKALTVHVLIYKRHHTIHVTSEALTIHVLIYKRHHTIHVTSEALTVHVLIYKRHHTIHTKHH